MSGLDPETTAAIQADAHLSRHQWTSDPQAVIDELDDTETVRAAAATWAGFHEHVPESAAMIQAVIAWVGADHPGIEAGRKRAASPWHGAP